MGVAFSNSNSALDQVTVNGVVQAAFTTDLASSLTLSGLRAVNNGSNEVYMTSGTLPGDRTWNFAGLPVELSSSLGVPSGTTLTVVPGQVVKMPNGSTISVTGTLNATGTVPNPIIFTSVWDDSAGGDSSNDGGGTGAPNTATLYFNLNVDRGHADAGVLLAMADRLMKAFAAFVLYGAHFRALGRAQNVGDDRGTTDVRRADLGFAFATDQ